ncbi:hypothetical protein CAPTEDRAFT_202989 [Capitella teleta]|uniref:Carbohydrate sulfotransferase n=1 Tax=Capitella teleta TaxID=283909 RepID=R7TNI0_CAPTE|nr:hypothetical protein CAPTEDRAFT_202989 [Capitella teleta]|eukprot:ELT95102.1 hypothetical protein CAPTEDRAFT_202989 [Capitella teleta]
MTVTLKSALSVTLIGIFLMVSLIQVWPRNFSIEKQPQPSNMQSYSTDRCSAEERAKYLEELCGLPDYSHEITTLPASKFFTDEKHRITLCSLPKTGMTSWKEFLRKLATGLDKVGHSHNRNSLKKRGITVDEGDKIYQGKYRRYYKLLEVRHPFSRLISAYKNRVYNKPDGPCKGPVRGVFPTWIQFAEYVVNGNRSCHNRHWMPYNELCPICEMKFDAVTKLETIHTDVADFLERHNFSDEYQFYQRNVAPGPPGKSTEDYINELPQELFSKLRKMLSADMKLFGYDIDDERRMSCGYSNAQCC